MMKIGLVETRNLKLFYQPQVTADGAQVVGLEALIRHEDPVKGLVSPGAFIPAFTSQELESLDWWVIHQAVEDIERWPDKLVSVNISATQLRSSDFAERVLDTIRAAGRNPGNFELEIVESSMITEFEKAADNVRRLREEGVRIALDDFGTGYSSLTYMLNFPLDKVKIDRSFVEKSDSLQGAAIIQAVVALARATGLKVTAEGVETQQQQRFLRTVGCHYLQGFFFSKPQQADAMMRFLTDWDSRAQLARRPPGDGPVIAA